MDPNRLEIETVAFVGVLLLYGQLFGYGIWVASGVIEEKASRVVEMLLSAIRPKQLLLGKMVGIGTLGLAQLIVISSFAIGLVFVTNAINVSSCAFGGAGLVIGWFILGFAFYATLFAAAGSLVTRMEELQNVIVPINLTILVSFFISIGALQDPNGRLQVIASIDRKSTRLNSSQTVRSYAVFCLKKKSRRSTRSTWRSSRSTRTTSSTRTSPRTPSAGSPPIPPSR